MVEGETTNAFTDLTGKPKRLPLDAYETLRQVAAEERKNEE